MLIYSWIHFTRSCTLMNILSLDGWHIALECVGLQMSLFIFLGLLILFSFSFSLSLFCLQKETLNLQVATSPLWQLWYLYYKNWTPQGSKEACFVNGRIWLLQLMRKMLWSSLMLLRNLIAWPNWYISPLHCNFNSIWNTSSFGFQLVCRNLQIGWATLALKKM